MKIKVAIPYNYYLIVDSEHFSALSEIINKSKVLEEKYVGGSIGYTYVEPKKESNRSVELAFVQEWQLEKDSKTVTSLLEQVAGKNSEIYKLQREMKAQAESIAQLTALVSLAHIASLEYQDDYT